MSEQQLPEPASPLPFGRYRLIERIGTGGMAEIWRGVAVGDHGFERGVAIKRIRDEVAEMADIGKLFADEARLSALLDHPNIVQVYDFGAVDGACYIAMEYLPGRNLDQVLLALRRTGERVNPALAAFIAREVARGLAYAHSLRDPRGRPYHIVHRDVSPANIMLLQAGAVKLLDFGIARVTSELRMAVTQGRAVRGKCPYLAPEQITGGTVDGRSDIFALGVVLWEMLTGQRLFGGESDLDIIGKVLSRVIPRPSSLAPDVPPELDRVVMAALARDIDRRYRLADFMAADLDEVTRMLPSGHGDLPALLGRLFGPPGFERAAEGAAAGRAGTSPVSTGPRFALELPTDAGGARPLAGPDEVTRRELPLVDAITPVLAAPNDASGEVVTAVEVGARLTTGRARAVPGPTRWKAFGMVLGLVVAAELAGALIYRALLAPAPAAPVVAVAAPAGGRCAPQPASAPACRLPAPDVRRAPARTAAAVAGARASQVRPGARDRKRAAVRARSWAIGRKSAGRTVARRTPSVRATELHVDPFAE